MQVYCKDCKHFKRSHDVYFSDYCQASELGITKNYIYGDYKTTKTVYEKDYPNKINTNGCTFYKEKNRWWKN